MDGFKRVQPPIRPTERMSDSVGAPLVDKPSQAVEIDQPILDKIHIPPVEEPPKTTAPSKWPKRIALTVFAVLVMLVGAYIWYSVQLQPVGGSETLQKVVVNKDTSYRYLVKRLKERGLIRSELATLIYGYSSGEAGRVKQGTCSLSPKLSTPEIIAKLTKGCHDFMSITFYPGATIDRPIYKPAGSKLEQKMYVRYILEKAGFSPSEIDRALAKKYTGPLFADKPDGLGLEGYVYGETYYLDSGSSAEAVLERSFSEMYSQIQKNNLVAKYQAQHLTLFQAITLASIVQSELNCEGKASAETVTCFEDQQKIAQVFLKRLNEGMALGSDVTFIYGADRMKVAPRVNLDSPYNTRIHTGLPPGPVSSPGIHALMAVGAPSDTDYLYFIAGDDGKIYFATDETGHSRNIQQHCRIGCGEL